MKEDKIFNELDHIDDFKVFDVDQEWSSFLAKTKSEDTVSSISADKDSSNQKSTATVRKLPLRILSFAAGIAVLIGCFFFLSQDNQIEEEAQIAETSIEVEPQIEDIKVSPNIKEQAEDAIVEVKTRTEFIQYQADQELELPDGSTVNILATSYLNIPDSFEGLLERNVGFKSGNVEFSITSNKNQPFRVLTDNSGIYVTGTTFRMLKAGAETVVKTISGSVEMYSLDDESVKTTINAGQEFSYNGETITEVIAEAPIEEITIEEPAEVKMSSFALKNIKELAKDHFNDNLKFDRKAIPKSLLKETVEIPSSAIKTGDVSTVDDILKALQEQFNVVSEPLEGCESCYRIKSISQKD